MYKYLLSLVCVLSLSAEMVDGVAVIVKEKAITLYEIKQEMRNSNVDAKRATNKLIRAKLEEAEIKEKRISVSSTEVYDDIKQSAEKNNMTVSQFYEAILNSNGVDSAELKDKVKQKLLSQKLYSAIAYSKVSEPSETEIADYYKLNKAKFSNPSAFSVVIYQANDKAMLIEKVQNPMFSSPNVQVKSQILEASKLSPELVGLLKNTPVNNFTSIIQNAQGGFMSFYVKDFQGGETTSIDIAKNQIINILMSKQREQVLSDHFVRLRDNANINFIRMPK